MARKNESERKPSTEEKRKRLLDQMDEWVHDIDVVLEGEPATLKRS